MLRFLSYFVMSLIYSSSIFSQEVNAVYDIQAGSEPNEYSIKTTISGLKGVDIARIKYFIDNNHTYKPSPNNAFFSDRNEEYIKFYIMAIPTSGIINIELGIILGGNGEYNFPVEFQYSRNEEKQMLNLPEIVLNGSGDVASVVEPTVEIPEPTPVIIEEQPIVETPAPTPEVVEEEAVVEIPKSIPTVIEEEPIVEVSEPTPIVVEEEYVAEPITSSKVATKYTVQLLSLLEFSQTRLKVFCKQHNIPLNKIKKNKKGEWMKITYGDANSIEEANQIREKVKRDFHINNSFIVPLN